MLPAWTRVVSFCVGLLWTAMAHPQVAAPLFDAELDPWTTGDGAAGDNFGRALAQDGDWLAVGAPGNVLADPQVLPGSSQGTVYLYQRGMGGVWEYRQTLLLPDPTSGATFGLALTMREDLLVVAAPRSSLSGPIDSGAVFFFARNQSGIWEYSSQLLSPMPGSDGNFGHALVLISATELIIGAPGEIDRGQFGAGAVYRYSDDGNGWQLQSRLVAELAESGAGFGSSLQLWGTDLLVGLPRAGMDDAGAVDRLTLPIGTPIQRLDSPLGAQSEFGYVLHGDGDLLAVGAPNANVSAIAGAGAVALYRGTALSTPAELIQAQTLEAQARFGEALWLDGTRLLSAAPQADVAPGFDEGLVEYYTVAAPGALFEGALSNPFPGLSGRLGKAISVDANGDLLIGADLDRVGPNNAQGSVSHFVRQGTGYAAPQRLTRGDGAYLERFGSALAVDRQWAVVSSFLERTEDGSEAGAVYVYRRSGNQWQRYQRLLSPDPAIEQRFGIAVSLVGDQLLVGAYWDASQGSTDAGAAYLFQLVAGNWVHSRSFYPPTPTQSGHFGFSVAIDTDGEALLIGEPGASVTSFGQGAGHLYREQGGVWSLEATLVSAPAEANAGYGSAVAIEGDMALLGGPFAQVDGVNEAGAVARFSTAPSWPQQERLVSSQPVELAHFGQSVAISDGILAVAAAQDTVGTQLAAGAIYVRRPAGLLQRLVASDARAGDRLGSQLALCGRRLLAGAPGVDVAQQSSQGALYVWADLAPDWAPLPRFLTPNGGGLEGLGLSVACDGELGLVGAPFKAVENPQEGRAYSVVVGNLFADQFE